ncbi:thioredoxin domain-containing protein [Pacificispira spongiicola]|nr:transcriptional regulator [Pacificispira spongiicola]
MNRKIHLWAIVSGAMAAMCFLLLQGVASSGSAAEMIYVQRDGCPWCKVVDTTVVPIWNKTEEGRRAPLRRVDSDAAWPEDLKDITPERLTPTFILVEDGEEIARLRGYPGEHFIWPMITEMVGKLPQ